MIPLQIDTIIKKNSKRDTGLENPLYIIPTLTQPLKFKIIKDVNALNESPSIFIFTQPPSDNICKDERCFNSIDMSFIL